MDDPFFWRRLRGSNPRGSCPPTRFPGVCLRPLGQASAGQSSQPQDPRPPVAAGMGSEPMDALRHQRFRDRQPPSRTIQPRPAVCGLSWAKSCPPRLAVRARPGMSGVCGRSEVEGRATQATAARGRADLAVGPLQPVVHGTAAVAVGFADPDCWRPGALGAPAAHGPLGDAQQLGDLGLGQQASPGTLDLVSRVLGSCKT